MKKAVLVLIVLMLSSLACTLTGQGSSATTPKAKVLFSDDFSNPDSGWPSISDEFGSADYKDGGYEITVKDAKSGYWSTSNLEDQTNVTIDVDATSSGASSDNDFGIICRGLDGDNHMLFLISADGYSVIGKFKDGTYQNLSSKEWLASSAIKQGQELNHIRADCVDNTFALYVNGQLVATATDDDFSTGMVGLTVGTSQDPNAAVMFDNFVVTENNKPVDVTAP